MKKFIVAATAVASMVPFAAQAAVLNLTDASTAITNELTPALTAAMPILGTILAVTIGLKFYKRITKG